MKQGLASPEQCGSGLDAIWGVKVRVGTSGWMVGRRIVGTTSGIQVLYAQRKVPKQCCLTVHHWPVRWTLHSSLYFLVASLPRIARTFSNPSQNAMHAVILQPSWTL